MTRPRPIVKLTCIDIHKQPANSPIQQHNRLRPILLRALGRKLDKIYANRSIRQRRTSRIVQIGYLDANSEGFGECHDLRVVYIEILK
jgi:hypothetical protein